jgi:hypothetical protein
MSSKVLGVTMTNKDLRDLVKYWKPRLKLRDWKVDIRFADDEESLDKLKSGFARTHRSPMAKEARTLIKPLANISKDSIGCRDIEVSVVHELIHLLFTPFDNFKQNDSRNDAVEHSIETLAIALVEIRRGEKVQ